MLDKHGTTKIICLTNIGHYYKKVQLVKICKLLHLHNKTSLSRNIYVYCYRAMQKDVKNGDKVKAESSNFKKQKEKAILEKQDTCPN